MTFRVSPEKDANQPKLPRLPTRMQTPALLQEAGLLAVLDKRAKPVGSRGLGEARTPDAQEAEALVSLHEQFSGSNCIPELGGWALREQCSPLPACDHAVSPSHRPGPTAALLASAQLAEATHFQFPI